MAGDALQEEVVVVSFEMKDPRLYPHTYVSCGGPCSHIYWNTPTIPVACSMTSTIVVVVVSSSVAGERIKKSVEEEKNGILRLRTTYLLPEPQTTTTTTDAMVGSENKCVDCG